MCGFWKERETSLVLYKSYCCTNQTVVGISRLMIRGIAKDLLSLASADPSALPCLGEEAEFVGACSSWEQISCQHHSREEVGRQEKRYSLINEVSRCLKATNSESRTCMSKRSECVCGPWLLGESVALKPTSSAPDGGVVSERSTGVVRCGTAPVSALVSPATLCRFGLCPNEAQASLTWKQSSESGLPLTATCFHTHFWHWYLGLPVKEDWFEFGVLESECNFPSTWSTLDIYSFVLSNLRLLFLILFLILLFIHCFDFPKWYFFSFQVNN